MKQTSKPTTESKRIYGSPINTVLNQLPERFTFGPHTEPMARYLSRRWSAHSYGWYKLDKSIAYNQESEKSRYRWVEDIESVPGIRRVGKAHEIKGNKVPWHIEGTESFHRSLIDNTGWYVDSWGNESVSGEVYQLPARDGQAIYVSAIEDHNGNGGALIDFHSGTDDIRQAIYTADSMAKRYAEDEREYQAKDQAEQQIADIDVEVKTLREKFKGLAREIRANCDKLVGLDRVRGLVREEYKRFRRETRELRKRQRELREDFWTAVPQ